MSKIAVKLIKWCIFCILAFLLSIFIHEVGHGLANSIRGIECSTGFNRVGDIYKYPSDPNFREIYSLEDDSLFDLGVPFTLILAIISTFIYRKSRNEKLSQVAIYFAATNSVIRLIPCLWVVLTPLLTGNIHMEDEYGSGTVLADITGLPWIVYLPALVSIFISVICLLLIILKARKYYKIRELFGYSSLLLLSFEIAMVIANYLDNIVRLQWQAI